jgi:hypothetical protein
MKEGIALKALHVYYCAWGTEQNRLRKALCDRRHRQSTHLLLTCRYYTLEEKVPRALYGWVVRDPWKDIKELSASLLLRSKSHIPLYFPPSFPKSKSSPYIKYTPRLIKNKYKRLQYICNIRKNNAIESLRRVDAIVCLFS